MSLTQEHDNCDFISDYNISKDGVFGTILRTVKGENFENNFLNKKTVTSEDIKNSNQLNSTNANINPVISKTYYFFMNKTHLVCANMGRIKIKEFQTHINWLLDKNDCNIKYIFIPIIINKDLKLSDIKQIILSDTGISGILNEKTDCIQTNVLYAHKQLLDLSVESVKKAFGLSTIEDIDIEHMVSAMLIIKFNKLKKKDEKKNEKLLQALLKHTDSDDLIVKTRDKKTYKGKDMNLSFERNINHTDGYPNIVSLRMEMIDCLKELR
jgi:hypothetical protein